VNQKNQTTVAVVDPIRMLAGLGKGNLPKTAWMVQSKFMKVLEIL
jgi:hypothetical protein